VVPVSGTVSTPRLLNSLAVSLTTGAVNEGAFSLSSACARMRLAALSGSRFLGWVGAKPKAADSGRSARRAAKVSRPFYSVMCMARALNAPAFAALRAELRTGARFLAFFAMVASQMCYNLEQAISIATH
jgi:hypothetical protein